MHGRGTDEAHGGVRVAHRQSIPGAPSSARCPGRRIEVALAARAASWDFAAPREDQAGRGDAEVRALRHPPCPTPARPGRRAPTPAPEGGRGCAVAPRLARLEADSRAAPLPPNPGATAGRRSPQLSVEAGWDAASARRRLGGDHLERESPSVVISSGALGLTLRIAAIVLSARASATTASPAPTPTTPPRDSPRDSLSRMDDCRVRSMLPPMRSRRDRCRG